MQSDILILFRETPPDSEMVKAKNCLMDVDRSVLVHQKEGSQRVLLVKFSPQAISPSTLLKVLRDDGFDVTMAGG